jgi:uncharacterized protein YndB with AHSA1/START domain
MRGIRKEAFYPHPRELIWRALTEPDLLADWLMANDIAPVVGRQFTFRMKPQPGFDGVVHCKVLEADPPRRLVYSWAGGGSKAAPQTVSWELFDERGGTRLVLQHTGFEGLFGLLLRTMMSNGWEKKLAHPQFFARVVAGLAPEHVA